MLMNRWRSVFNANEKRHRNKGEKETQAGKSGTAFALAKGR